MLGFNGDNIGTTILYTADKDKFAKQR